MSTNGNYGLAKKPPGTESACDARDSPEDFAVEEDDDGHAEEGDYVTSDHQTVP